MPFLTSQQPVSSMLTPVSGIDATPQTRDLSARLSVGQPLVVVAVFLLSKDANIVFKCLFV